MPWPGPPTSTTCGRRWPIRLGRSTLSPRSSTYRAASTISSFSGCGRSAGRSTAMRPSASFSLSAWPACPSRTHCSASISLIAWEVRTSPRSAACPWSTSASSARTSPGVMSPLKALRTSAWPSSSRQIVSWCQVPQPFRPSVGAYPRMSSSIVSTPPAWAPESTTLVVNSRYRGRRPLLRRADSGSAHRLSSASTVARSQRVSGLVPSGRVRNFAWMTT